MRKEILQAYPDEPIKVYAVWFNMFWGDEQSKWPGDILNDDRVLQFWDEEKIAGRWFEKKVSKQGGKGEDRIEWDAYFLYGPNASWPKNGVPELVSRGRTIVATRAQLKKDLAKLIDER